MEHQGLLKLVDNFFVVFHTALILFNLFAWMWKPLQKWHFVTITLTFASWIILGIWYGWGYCFLTDWHWDVLRELGETDLPSSYISYLMERLFGLQFPDTWVDAVTAGLAVIVLIASIKVNFFSKNSQKH
ncbi:DUF2784 domain-containing protein [Negadavirga shengliensis]|uniref:DUF2784 domain-containing protein n=1 Tax=Negadavirga shengliensis TaxID=1389218 RepID=A0ABV9T2Y2_9BACT